MKRNDLNNVLCAGGARNIPLCGLASFIVPRGTLSASGRNLVFWLARTVFVGQTQLHRLSLPRPTELSAITPDPMQNGRQPAGERDDSLSPPAPLGHLHGPGFQPGPAAGSGQDDLSRFKQQRSHHGIAAQRDPADRAAFP